MDLSCFYSISILYWFWVFMKHYYMSHSGADPENFPRGGGQTLSKNPPPPPPNPKT